MANEDGRGGGKPFRERNTFQRDAKRTSIFNRPKALQNSTDKQTSVSNNGDPSKKTEVWKKPASSSTGERPTGRSNQSGFRKKTEVGNERAISGMGVKQTTVSNSANYRKRTEVGKQPATPKSDARRVALLALCDVTMHAAYANLALNKRLTEGALTPEDRRLATTIFYTALEKRIQIGFYLRSFVEKMPEDVCREILHIAASQILYLDRVPDHAAVDEAVRQVKRLRLEQYVAFVNATLRSLIRARDAGTLLPPDKGQFPVRHLSVTQSVSEPLAKRMADTFGEETAEKILAYRPEQRWETLRINPLRTDDATFVGLLEKRGWTWKKSELPGCYQVTGAGDLTADTLYANGIYSVQGLTSCLAARALGAKPGMNVLDACAAPGGKASCLCEMMGDTGRVYALELHEHRSLLIKAQAKRLNLFGMRVITCDARDNRPAFEDAMDGVLIDAPCTGLGVLHEKPDMRFTYRDEAVSELVGIQKSILDACAAYVKRGGALVYSTCSILPEENEKQVLDFLARHPDFEPYPLDTLLPERLRALEKDGRTQFFAHRDEGMDGFFIARMRRKRA